MKITFNGRGWADYQHLMQNEPAAFEKVNGFIKECGRTPFKGTGKPEPLQNDMRGYWSRRVSHEDRFVYRVVGSGDDQTLEIAQCRFTTDAHLALTS